MYTASVCLIPGRKQGELEQAGPYEEVVLEHIPDESSLKAQGQWLAAHIQLWADEEWTVLPVHEELARITAKVHPSWTDS